MPSYKKVDGILVEPVGHLWAAFSPSSGETALLNDECAAVLEVLNPDCCTSNEVAAVLATESGVEVAPLLHVVESTWPRLVEAGLVLAQPVSPTATR
jgi:hypothetical protein